MARSAMNVSLTPELEEFILAKVGSGLYQTSSEVVREALRMMRERDAMYLKQREQIREQIEAGAEALARGEYVSGEAWEEEIRQRRASRKHNANPSA